MNLNLTVHAAVDPTESRDQRERRICLLRLLRYWMRSPRQPQCAHICRPLRGHLLYARDARHGHPAQRWMSGPHHRYVCFCADKWHVLTSYTVKIPEGSLLSPSRTAAVCGGNVLTSQRIVDVVLKAFHACAASQGCTKYVLISNWCVYTY